MGIRWWERVVPRALPPRSSLRLATRRGRWPPNRGDAGGGSRRESVERRCGRRHFCRQRSWHLGGKGRPRAGENSEEPPPLSAAKVVTAGATLRSLAAEVGRGNDSGTWRAQPVASGGDAHERATECCSCLPAVQTALDRRVSVSLSCVDSSTAAADLPPPLVPSPRRRPRSMQSASPPAPKHSPSQPAGG